MQSYGGKKPPAPFLGLSLMPFHTFLFKLVQIFVSSVFTGNDGSLSVPFLGNDSGPSLRELVMDC